MSNCDIRIDDHVIDQVKEAEFLGVTIDSGMTWKTHVNNIKVKLSKITGILYKTRYSFNIETLKQIYHALAYPHMIYCSTIWGGTNKTNLDALFLAQKKLVRIITYQSYNAHTSPIFKELGLLKLNDILFIHTVKFI